MDWGDEMVLSVTKTILANDDILEVDNPKLYIDKWEVKEFVKRLPLGPKYTVIYTLDDKGPLLVVKKLIMIVMNIKTKEDMGACFLPESWDGKRVRRKVIIPTLN